METVLNTSQEWLWAVDGYGNFTYSGRASAALLGYEPEELIGRPLSTVIDPDELASASEAVAEVLGWSRLRLDRSQDLLPTPQRRPVWMEVAGRSRPTRDGPRPGIEGSGRPLPTQTVGHSSQSAAGNGSTARSRAD